MNWKEICKSQDIDQLRQAVLLLDINEKDERGRTPLMLLITNRSSLEAIQMILDQHPDLEIKDKLGHTALQKAIKFKQIPAITALIEAGARLDSDRGVLDTAWNLARTTNKQIADLLLATTGSVRSVLTNDEQQQIDHILYEEDQVKVCQCIRQWDSSILLHAFVQQYNWDDGVQPMIAVLENPACMYITKFDIYEGLDGDYLLSQADDTLSDSDEQKTSKQLAQQLQQQLKEEHHG